MHKWRVVFICQQKISAKDAGMEILQMILIAIIGILPVFVKNLTAQFEILAVFPLFRLKQLASESISLEKENKTIEQLVSIPLKKEDLILGKAAFVFHKTFIYFLTAFILQCITRTISGQSFLPGTIISYVVFILAYLNIVALISLSGVYQSAICENMSEANSKLSIRIYPAMIVILILVALLTSDTLAFMVISLFVFLISVLLEITAFRKMRKMKHSDFLKVRI